MEKNFFFYFFMKAEEENQLLKFALSVAIHVLFAKIKTILALFFVSFFFLWGVASAFSRAWGYFSQW